MRERVVFRAGSSHPTQDDFNYATRFDCDATDEGGLTCTAFVGNGEQCQCKRMKDSQWCRKHHREKKVLYRILKVCENDIAGKPFNSAAKGIAYKIYDLRKRISSFYESVDDGHQKAMPWWIKKVQQWTHFN